MKILFIAAANSTHTARWVNALALRGNEIHLAYNKGHDPATDAISGKVKLYPLKYSGTKGYYLNAFQLRQIKRKVQPDVVHVHYASGYGTLARYSGISPVLLSVWGSDVYLFPYESTLKRYILRQNVRYARMLASTSFCMAEQLRRVMGEKNLKINITPFGVDMKKFSPDLFRKKASDQIVLGSVKSLEVVYGMDRFIKAVSMLLDHLKKSGYQEICDRIIVKIYGDGGQKEELKHLIREQDLTDKIFLKGKIANEKVPEVLGEMDVFCAASLSESFGVSVVEAMAMEIPVVVSDAEGFREVVSDQETGFIVSQNRIDEMAEKLECLVLDPDLRKRFGEAGRKRAEELYDWEKNVSLMEDLYRRMKDQDIS